MDGGTLNALSHTKWIYLDTESNDTFRGISATSGFRHRYNSSVPAGFSNILYTLLHE